MPRPVAVLVRRSSGQSEKQAASASTISGTSSAEASSRQECIASCGMPTSTVAMPSRVAVSGPIVLPHGRSARMTKRLHRHAGLGAPLAEPAAGRRVGRVGLVGVQLDHRAAAEPRLVGRLVPVGAGGVHAVRHVRRDQPGARDRPVHRLAVARVGGRGQPADDVLEEAAARPGHRAAAHLLVVVARRAPACAPPPARPAARAARRGSEVRLSSRGAAIQLPSAPARAAGWVSASTRSWATTSSGAAPAAAATASISPGSSPRSPSHTGTRWRWGSRVRPSRTERSRWMASDGKRSGAPGSRTSAVPPPRRTTRPATVSSRSSQVCHSPPP